MSVVAVCPGSFDPVTNGHLDVIERAAARVDRLVVGCLRNIGKDPVFELDERVAMVADAVGHLPNVQVEAFEGLLVDFCRAHHASIVIKGLRAVSDFESELQMAQMNRRLGDVETLLLPTAPAYSFLSSSLVKEVARLGGDVSGFVPDPVARRLAERLGARPEGGGGR